MTDKPNSDEEPEFDWDTSDSSFDDYDSDWNHDNDPVEEGGMSFLEHLEEFRWTVGRSILAFLVGVFVIGYARCGCLFAVAAGESLWLSRVSR